MAKNKDSKISVNALDKLLGNIEMEQTTVTIEAGDASLEVTVDRHVTLQAFCDMVQEAAESCFQMDDEGQEHYVAGIGDFACDYAMLKYMTNLKTAVDVQNAQQQNDRLYTLCTNTDLVKRVENTLPASFVVDYHNAVYEQVEFHKQRLLSNERKRLTAAIEQLEKANISFAKFVEMFQGIDPAVMVNMMQEITSMDEAKLGEAIVGARDKEFAEQKSSRLEAIK